jgi:NADH:ubiquinone oxidoreductase subunit
MVRKKRKGARWVILILFMNKLLTLLYLSIFGQLVGEDNYGNKYFELKKKDSFGRKKRVCLFRGRVEASKISPEWHLFMHYQKDSKEIPVNIKQYKWQRSYLPDLTLTSVKYLPKNHPSYSGKTNLYNAKGAGNPFKFQPWKPGSKNL